MNTRRPTARCRIITTSTCRGKRLPPTRFYLRGFHFDTINIYKSDATKFIVTEKGLLPPFVTVHGLGEAAALDTVEDGVMTGDLAPLCDTPVEAVDTDTFMASIRTRLDMRMQSA